MKVYYDQSPAGTGKTHNIIINLTSRAVKVLYVTERRASFPELEAWMRREAARQGTTPIIETIRSDSNERPGVVSRQVEALPDRHRLHRHVIVIVTHAAMLRSDFSDFGGWEIVVDEVPPFLDFEDKRTFLDFAFFNAHYRLEPLNDSWSIVKAEDAAKELTPTDIKADQSHEHLAVFHRRVLEASREDSRRIVLCNLPDWTAMENRKVQWCWASAFSLWELATFDRITLLGNRFRADIGARISEALNVEEIEWVELPSPTHGHHFQARRVHINYFSDDRLASRHLFETDAGQKMLADIGARLAKELNGHEHIWSANDVTP